MEDFQTDDACVQIRQFLLAIDRLQVIKRNGKLCNMLYNITIFMNINETRVFSGSSFYNLIWSDRVNIKHTKCWVKICQNFYR